MRPPLVSADATIEAALKSCSVACRGAVAYYLSAEEAAQSEFGRCLLRAEAAIDAAAAALNADPDQRSATLAIVAPVCRAAAARCRRGGLDAPLLKAAAACERAAAICERRLSA